MRRPRRGTLPVQRTVCRSFIVDNEDIHDVQIPSLQELCKRWIALQHVRMCVYRMKLRKRLLQCGRGLARTIADYNSGTDDRPKQSLQSISHRIHAFAFHGAVVARRRLALGTYLVETAPWIVTELFCSLEEPSSPVA